MAVNKVVYGDDTLIDLTEDTVTPEDVLNGVSFHSADGEQKTGSVVVAPLSDTEVSQNKVWSSKKTNSMLDSWHTNAIGEVDEQILNSGNVGEREIEFSVTLDYCYRLFADSPNGKMVTIKSSKFEKEGETPSGVDYGKLTYVVNIAELPTKFRLREFKL